MHFSAFGWWCWPLIGQEMGYWLLIGWNVSETYGTLGSEPGNRNLGFNGLREHWEGQEIGSDNQIIAVWSELWPSFSSMFRRPQQWSLIVWNKNKFTTDDIYGVSNVGLHVVYRICTCTFCNRGYVYWLSVWGKYSGVGTFAHCTLDKQRRGAQPDIAFREDSNREKNCSVINRERECLTNVKKSLLKMISLKDKWTAAVDVRHRYSQERAGDYVIAPKWVMYR